MTVSIPGIGITIVDIQQGGGSAGVSSLNSLTGALTLTEYSEVPSGTVNGSNVTFTLANTPLSNQAVQVVLNGLTQYNGSSGGFSGDFTVSGNTVTFTTAPSGGTSIYAFYLSFSSSAAPSNPYVAEDGATYYVAEDGSTYYVQEM